MSDSDAIILALYLLDTEAPKKGVVSQGDPSDPRRRSYVVPTLEGRKQVVQCMSVPDSLFGERLEMVSVAVREPPRSRPRPAHRVARARPQLSPRAGLCTFDAQRPRS